MIEAQNHKILQHLKTGKSISPLEAINLCGCMRLAARVFDLRDEGWPIHCEKRPVGFNRRVGFYTLDMDRDKWPS